MAYSPVKYLNKVMLKGRLGKDPEIRFLPSGATVCNFSIATKNGKHVEWHRMVAYDTLADYINSAFKTGDFVYIEAEIKTREFLTADDKEKNRKPRKVTELIINEAHLLEHRRDAGEDEELLTSSSVDEYPIQLADSRKDSDPTGLPSFV